MGEGGPGGCGCSAVPLPPLASPVHAAQAPSSHHAVSTPPSSSCPAAAPALAPASSADLCCTGPGVVFTAGSGAPCRLRCSAENACPYPWCSSHCCTKPDAVPGGRGRRAACRAAAVAASRSLDAGSNRQLPGRSATCTESPVVCRDTAACSGPETAGKGLPRQCPFRVKYSWPVAGSQPHPSVSPGPAGSARGRASASPPATRTAAPSAAHRAKLPTCCPSATSSRQPAVRTPMRAELRGGGAAGRAQCLDTATQHAPRRMGALQQVHFKVRHRVGAPGRLVTHHSSCTACYAALWPGAYAAGRIVLALRG